MTALVLLAWAVAPQEAAEALKPLEFLIGTWTGEGKFKDGTAYTDERRFEQMTGGSFLKEDYTLWVGERVVWTATTIIGFDLEKKRIVVFGFAQNGSIARMQGVESDKKDTWTFEGRAVGPGVAQDERGTMTKIDADTISNTVEVKKGDRYEALKTAVYKRKK